MSTVDTTLIDLRKARDTEIESVVSRVYDALLEKGYNPVSQFVGYIMSGDPTYITSHKSARSLITKVERDEILNVVFRKYFTEK